MQASCAAAPRIFCAFLWKDNLTSTSLCLRIEFMQQQVLQLYGRAKTIEQVNAVFKLASELITLTEELNPLSSTLYELVLERRTELLKKPQQRAYSASWFPLRVHSLKSRSDAASGKRDPRRIARKRSFSAAAAMPPRIRRLFTEGERAVLYIIASDIRQTGTCRCTNKEIGDRAGVGLTTTRNALRKARTHRLISVEHREQWRGKNLSNILRMVSSCWKHWLSKFRPKQGFAKSSKGVRKAMSSETFGIKEQKETISSLAVSYRSEVIPAHFFRKPSYG